MARRFTRVQKEMLATVRDELARHGVEDFEVVHKKRHTQVRWRGGSVALSNTPSDRMAGMALRSDVRKQCREREG